MPKAGTYTALKHLQPITTDFGRIAKEEEALQFKYREEQDKNLAKEKAVKDEIANGFTQDYDTLVDVVTNNKSIDEAFARGINSARDRMGEIYRGIKNDPTLLDDVDTQLKLQNLTKFSQNLKTVSDRYTQYASDVSGGMQDGTLSQWNNDTLKDLDSIFVQANLNVETDPETGLPIAVIGEVDQDGQPTGELKRLNLIEVLDGRGLQDTVPTFDLAKESREVGDKLGERLKSVQKGFTTIEEQSFEKIEGDVREMAKGFLGSVNRPSDKAKAIWSDYLGEDAKELDEADMKRIEDYYVASIKPYYDEEYKKSIDQSGALAATKYKDEKNKEEEGEDTTGGGIQIETDTSGNPLKVSPTGVYGDIGNGAYSFTLPVVKGKNGKKTPKVVVDINGEETSIERLYLTKAGKIAYEGYKSGGKKSTTNKNRSSNKSSSTTTEDVTETTIGGGLNENQLNIIARALGKNNASELKKELEGVRNSYMDVETTDYKATTEESSR